jgi:hypothetical protein
MAQPRSKKRSTRPDGNGLKQREYRDKQGRVHHHTRKYMEGGEASQSGEPQKRRRSSSPSRTRLNEHSDRGLSLGNLAQSIADRPGLLLAAASAAASAGTLLMSRWFGENGWLRRSFGRGGDTNRNEARALEPAQHTRLEHASQGGVNREVGFEGVKASQQEAVAQAGGQSQGSARPGQGNAQGCNRETLLDD